MKTKRKIVAVTGARSEYDIVSPVMELLRKDEEVESGFIVTGPHLSEKFGMTVQEVERDGFVIYDKLNNLVESSEKTGRIESIGKQIILLTASLNRIKPDVVLVTGDREEAISTTMVCAFLNIAVAHIAGGDIAKDGNIDNAIRYASSKFAHVHFVILPEHKNTLLKLGEDEWRIHITGNPALDKFISTRQLPVSDLSLQLKFGLEEQNYLLVIYHPIVTEFEREEEKANILIDFLLSTGMKCVINSPNSDAGYEKIVKTFLSRLGDNKNFQFFKNLPREVYVNLMRHSFCMVGNSSSGLIEAPSLGLPVINTGSRQRGRFHANNVQFVDMNMVEMTAAFEKIKNTNMRAQLKGMINPYGDGKSACEIVNVLKALTLDNSLLHKNITY